MNNDQMIDGLKSNKKKAVVNKWGKCWCQGCPLNASVEAGGSQTCGHHFDSHYPSAVTAAIKNNINFLNGYRKMLHWTGEQWVENEEYLLNNKQFPMKPKQARSFYLNEYYSWVCQKIKAEASEIIIHSNYRAAS